MFGKKTPPYEIGEDNHGIGKVFILRSPWRDKYATTMRRRGVEALRLPGAGYGFKAQPIDFVGELDFLRSVEVYHYDIQDLTPLAQLNNIEVLGLQVASAKGIEGWRPPLRVLLARWCKQLQPLLSLPTLEYVNISNYPFTDLTPIKSQKLRRLFLTSRKLESLGGAETFPELQHVDLYNCPNLKSTSELDSIKSMRKLEVETCRHISRERVVRNFSE